MKLTADLPIVDPNNGLVSDELKRGILETGFFLLRDRTVALEALHELRQHTYEFFSKPLEEKLKFQTDGRGYTALQGEDSEAGFGTGKYGAGDYCEKYSMGSMQEEQDKTGDPEYYAHPDALGFYAKNVFPNAEFEAAWNNYYRHMHDLAEELMAAIRQVLGYPPEQWQQLVDRPTSLLRFLAYPSHSGKDSHLAAHYDDDIITILHQSPSANGFDALEVMLPGDTQWRAVPADDTMFVVNVGNILSHLTEGRVVATKHRVVSPPKALETGSARSSIAFFYSPNWDARFKPLMAPDMDKHLGQQSPVLHLDDLIEEDGTIVYHKVINREVELMLNKPEPK